MEKEISRKLEKLIHIYTFCVPADVHTFNDFYIIQILFIFFAAFPCTFSTVLFTFFQERANENKKKSILILVFLQLLLLLMMMVRRFICSLAFCHPKTVTIPMRQSKNCFINNFVIN